MIRHPVGSLLGVAAYLGVLLIHESGHLMAAQWMRCEVFSIQLYPIFGITKFETPWSKFDHCVIAWGGVIAQAVVAFPVVTWVIIFGYTRFEPINAVLALLGFFSLVVAAFNLLPIPPRWRYRLGHHSRIYQAPARQSKQQASIMEASIAVLRATSVIASHAEHQTMSSRTCLTKEGRRGTSRRLALTMQFGHAACRRMHLRPSQSRSW